jgi:hypothetical protein
LVDDAHFAPKHVDQLRQVLNPGVPEKLTNLGGPPRPSRCRVSRVMHGGSPPRPMHSRRSRTGPVLSSFITKAMVSIKGKVSARNSEAITKSLRRFIGEKCLPPNALKVLRFVGRRAYRGRILSSARFATIVLVVNSATRTDKSTAPNGSDQATSIAGVRGVARPNRRAQRELPSAAPTMTAPE